MTEGSLTPDVADRMASNPHDRMKREDLGFQRPLDIGSYMELRDWSTTLEALT